MKLRNFTGELHIIPNGLITQVTNHSRGNMSAIVDVSIAYEEDIDNAINVLEGLCRKFTQKHQEVIEVQVLGVQAFGANEVIIRVFAKTLPMEQWKIERQLRKKISPKRRGIES